MAFTKTVMENGAVKLLALIGKLQHWIPKAKYAGLGECHSEEGDATNLNCLIMPEKTRSFA